LGGVTDSKVVDEQAVFEGMSTLLMGALGGGNLIHDVGFMESGLTGSLPFLVMMDEAIHNVKRILREYRVDSETLALDVIEEVGLEGDFFTHQHTLKHFKEELWYPRLLDRSIYERWIDKGGLTLGKRANEEVKIILDSHRPMLLEKDIEKELKGILKKAEKHVLDSV
jgi:trimethylamine--corrinoid protein Co-methyltransferase